MREVNIKEFNFSMTARYVCPKDKQRKSVVLKDMIIETDTTEDDFDRYQTTTVSFRCSCGDYHEVVIQSS